MIYIQREYIKKGQKIFFKWGVRRIKQRDDKEKTQKRLEAVNVATAINRIVDPAIFPDLLYAVDNKDKVRFAEACKAAYIPDDMKKYLWSVIIEKSIYDAKYEQDQAFCWV